MCGLAGYFSKTHLRDHSQIIGRMMEQLRHRGPDAGGSWIDDTAGIVLGHRRLSIIDLSSNGAQPMISDNGYLVLTYNGEIYNHRKLRHELNQTTKINWRGHSDTEVLINAIAAWGLDETLRRAEGMFAFALWDRATQSLHLARDAFGEKPLYYGWHGNVFLFGSELKALTVHPAFDRTLDMCAVAEYLKYGYVPAPLCIYRNTRKLSPGTYLTLQAGHPSGHYPAETGYWNAAATINLARKEPFAADETQALPALEKLLKESVTMRMESDVPLGALLSGGIDSSLVVAMMQAESHGRIRTFSIGSREPGYDESGHALNVARHLGTEHTELIVTPADALAVIPELPQIYDEPFADSSQIPACLVSALARQQVTVALSGDGGDELFAGYNRYSYGTTLWQNMQRVPLLFRKMAASALQLLSPDAWNSLAAQGAGRVHAELSGGRAGEKIHKLAAALRAGTEHDFMQGFLENGNDPALLMQNYTRHNSSLMRAERPEQLTAMIDRMMYADVTGYLPDDILTKVDRASMRVGLELRTPFLDRQLFYFSWTLPPQFRIADGKGKYLLRKLLYRHVPQHLLERPKQGFGIPVGRWLRNELKDWGEALLDEKQITAQGYLNAAAVRQLWDAHQAGRVNYDTRLWSILMFQAWLKSCGIVQS